MTTKPVVKVWKSGRDVTNVECLACGKRDLAGGARWARKHAQENPGHKVVVDRDDATYYEAQK